MINIELSGIFSAGVIFLYKNVARTVLFIFHNKPSGVASVHGKGPRGSESTSAM